MVVVNVRAFYSDNLCSILSKDVHFIARNPYKNYSFNKAMNYLVIKHLVKQYFMKKRVSVTCAH